MNNYSHSYSQYVNHILNKSPSKTTYSFSKAPRFPPPRQEFDYLDTDYYHHQSTFERTEQNETPNRSKSPIQRSRNVDRFQVDQNRESNSKNSVQRNVEEIINRQGKTTKNKSRSKSPYRNDHLQSQRSFRRKQHSFRKEQNETQQKYESPSKQKQFIRSPSKSPHRDSEYRRHSPSKTFTQQLYEIEHPSKNITIGGYYPTGIELSAEGKFPVSTQRNTQSHSFGRIPAKQRYSHLLKTEDYLGPGYYDHYSQFGPLQQRR